MKDQASELPIRAAFGIICWDKQEFLLVQEKSNEGKISLWKNVGGKVDYGETSKEAIGREIEEEVMVKLKIKEMFFTFSKPLCHHPHAIEFFDINLTGVSKEDFRKNESQLIKMKWMTVQEVEIEMAYGNILPAHRDAIFAYCKRYYIPMSIPVSEIS